MSANGKRRPRRPRIEIVSATASGSEAAAIVAALEQFLADTAPPPHPAGSSVSPWQGAALEEGISARKVSGAVWGIPLHATLRTDRTTGPEAPLRGAGGEKTCPL